MNCPRCGALIRNPQAARCLWCSERLVSEVIGGGDAAASPPASQDTAGAPFASQPSRRPLPPPEQYSPGYESYGPPQAGQMAQPGWAAPPGMPPGFTPAPLIDKKKQARKLFWLNTLSLLFLSLAGLGFRTFLHFGENAVPVTRTPTRAPIVFGSVTPFANTPAGEQVIFQDTLRSGATGWANDEPKCFSQDDGYHVADGYLCYAPVEALSDVTISVDAEQISGSVQMPYGIVLRAARQGYRYEFNIYSDGQWSFGKVVNDNNTYTALIWPQADEIIKRGLHTINHLMVRARGTHFEFFVNGTKVGETDDDTFASGRSGLDCYRQGEALFTNFQMTKPAA